MNFKVLFFLSVLLVALSLASIVALFWFNLGADAEDTIDVSCLRQDTNFTCFSANASSYYRFYGTKTMYQIARKVVKRNSTNYIPPGCKPLFFYMFSRHAARYPDEEYIVEFQERLPVLVQKIIDAYKAKKGKLCRSDILKFLSWKLRMIPSDDNRVSKSGFEETRRIAKRYRARFPNLLDQDYSPEKYVFGFTSRNRTLTTLKAFTAGLFGDAVSRNINYSYPEDDVLQFHKVCKAIMKEKGINVSKIPEEVVKLEKSNLFSTLLSSVSEKVGFKVSKEDITTLKRVCVFEFAIYGQSPWCSLFEEDDMKILEFEDDLDDYYSDGYGRSVNYMQACPIVRDLIQHLKAYMNSSEPQVVVQFSHAGAIKKVLSRFGLFRDFEPLIAKKFCEQTNRQWKSSLICPFTSNLAIVMYLCDGVYYLRAFVQEEPVVLEGCTSDLCNIHEFLQHYEPIGKNCNLYDICSKPSS